jgi:hypothetical protein
MGGCRETFDEFAGSVLRAGPESATASRQTIYAAHRVAPHGGSGAYLSERAAPFFAPALSDSLVEKEHARAALRAPLAR